MARLRILLIILISLPLSTYCDYKSLFLQLVKPKGSNQKFSHFLRKTIPNEEFQRKLGLIFNSTTKVQSSNSLSNNQRIETLPTRSNIDIQRKFLRIKRSLDESEISSNDISEHSLRPKIHHHHTGENGINKRAKTPDWGDFYKPFDCKTNSTILSVCFQCGRETGYFRIYVNCCAQKNGVYKFCVDFNSLASM